MQLKIKEKRAIFDVMPGATGVLGLVSRLEGSKIWLKDGGGLSLVPSGYNLEIINALFPDTEVVHETASAIEEFDLSGASAYLPKTKPRDHQLRAAQEMECQRAFALFMAPGTGKTKSGIDRAGQLFCAQKISGMVIVAPKGIHNQWIFAQFPIHCGVPYIAFAWPIKEFPAALRPSNDALKVLSVGWDRATTDIGFNMIAEFIRVHRGRVLFVGDESHVVKNPSTQRWKATQALAQHCDYRLILTGTPLAKDLKDVWGQLRLLDENILGIRYRTSFENEYCIMGGFERREVIGYRNLERFLAKVAPHVFSITRAEIGMLPPNRSPWLFAMNKTQKQMIKAIKKDLIYKMDNGDNDLTAETIAVAILKAQQIASGFYIENIDAKHNITRELFAAEDNPRMIALLQLIATIDESEKIVIWSRFRYDAKKIVEVLGKQNCVLYVGGMTGIEQAEAIRMFQINSSKRFFVSNPSAGGTGIDGLQVVCSHDIFYSHSANFIHRTQAEARIERIGGANIVNHFDLIGNGCFDKRYIRSLKRKEMMSAIAFGDLRGWLEEDEDDDPSLYYFESAAPSDVEWEIKK